MCKHFRDVQLNAGEGLEDKVATVKAAVKKEIDWTKPIKWRVGSERSLLLKYVGLAYVCVADELDQIYIVNRTTGKCRESGLTHWYVENIPEPKKETWVNIYWHDGFGTRAGRPFPTKDMAHMFIAGNDMLRYIVTAQIE